VVLFTLLGVTVIAAGNVNAVSDDLASSMSGRRISLSTPIAAHRFPSFPRVM
jgi:hypothetical protein